MEDSLISGCGVHHISIKARNFDKSLEFYRDVLGFKQKHLWDHETGPVALLDLGDGNYLEIWSGSHGSASEKTGIIHFALKTDDLDGSVERLRSAGVNITLEPLDIIIPGTPELNARIAFFHGPDGESIELFMEYIAAQ